MKTIIIYSTPTCGYCKMAKAFFQSQSIPYTERDVTVDPNYLNKMQEAAPGNLSVPVIVFNEGLSDQVVQIGYQQEEIEKVLGI